MSLSIQTSKSLPPFEKSDSKESNKKDKTIEAKILLLGENYIEGSKLSGDTTPLIEKGILSKSRVQIHLAQVNDYKFKESGFEFVNLRGLILDDAWSFAAKPDSKRYRVSLIKSAGAYVTEWAKAQGFKFHVAVPLNFKYRNEDPSVKKCGRPFILTHTDFDPTHLQKTFRKAEKEFKPQFKTIFGEMSTERYHSLCSRIKTTFNLWISLNEIPTSNTLCLMDTRSFSPSDLKPCKTDTDSMSILFNHNQKWVACEGMEFGKGIIFNSQETPHVAATLPKQKDWNYERYRESAEIRFGLIEEDNDSIIGEKCL